jgi:predicted transcriptional regulator
VLGSLETEVLLALRELAEAPARDVRAALERRGIRLAYTTVATILARLYTKGLVRRRRQACQGGERYLYRPAEVEQKYLRNILRGVVAMFGPAGVVHLNEEIAKLNPGEEEAVRRRLGIG